MTNRRTYHHGDLRAALVDAGLALAREEGSSSLGLREAARQVGVSPNAVYRHFDDRDALVAAVADEIRVRMADEMRRRMGRLPTDPHKRAQAQLRAVGLGYIGFALAEPGWFDLAFFDAEQSPTSPVPGPGRAAPYIVLVEALDAMVDAGALPRTRRRGAEWACWSTVHGFAVLANHGPLRHVDKAAVDKLARRCVDDIIAGIT